MQRPQQAGQRGDLVGLVSLTSGHPEPGPPGHADRLRQQPALADSRRPFHHHHRTGARSRVHDPLGQDGELLVAASDPAAAAGVRVFAGLGHACERCGTRETGQEQPKPAAPIPRRPEACCPASMDAPAAQVRD